jgi:hypothetical protein
MPGGRATIFCMTTELARSLDGFLAKLIFGRAERRQRERAEFIAKFDRYMAAATLLAAECGTIRSTEARSGAGKVLNWLASGFDLLSTDAQDEAMGRWFHPREYERYASMTKDFVEAQIKLGTVAPPAVRSEMERLSSLLVDWSNDRANDRSDEWLTAAKRLRHAADEHLHHRWWRLRRRRGG